MKNPVQAATINAKNTNNVFKQLGFPDNMTYGQRASLRKKCSQILRFAYLIDFMSLEGLANVYTGSVSDMIERLKTLNDESQMDEIMKRDFNKEDKYKFGGYE